MVLFFLGFGEFNDYVLYQVFRFLHSSFFKRLYFGQVMMKGRVIVGRAVTMMIKCLGFKRV